MHFNNLHIKLLQTYGNKPLSSQTQNNGESNTSCGKSFYYPHQQRLPLYFQLNSATFIFYLVKLFVT